MATEENKPQIIHPIINGLQKMALYTTRSRCYLIGSNNTQTKFRVLKIDRTEPHDLIITDDNVEYSQSEIKELLLMIGGGNKIPLRTTATTTKVSSGVVRTVSAFGIFGFIRFLEGYYLILITKRRKVAVIGQHSIYKVEDTSVIYLPHESVRKNHEDEHKYLKLLGNIDLTSNFYFSYTYDLTNSLQHNMNHLNNMEPVIKDSTESFMHSVDEKTMPRTSDQGSHFGVRLRPSEKFVWNSYLLEPLRKNAHHCWVLPITQGFVAQSNISVFGRSFFLTLIARRSAAYAGTRFLKRGANCEGDVANEVETEQIVNDAHISSIVHGRFTSFVQIRGSIPCHWSQDISKMVPKPPITIDVWDPYAETAGKHFNKLLRRFGSPLVVLNLVKRREKKRHESILNEEYIRLIQQLNVTLPPSHRIQHVAVDMARINKDKKESVMSRLAEISYQSIKKTGIFQSSPPYHIHHLDPDPHYRHLERTSTQGDKNFGNRKCCCCREGRRLQTGVVRVNCVDCLDRTNTAQFCLGKCALAFQLYCLGVLEKPTIEFDSACVRMLEEMYEDHGDTLALQYGGSQLVHRIATYRKTAPWSSQGNDIMHSLSRYLSNTFSDQEKQEAINLFLGVYIPLKQIVPLWELTSDYLLHHSSARNTWPCHKKSTSQWWDDEAMKTLPLPCEQVNKKAEYVIPLDLHDPRVDLYYDFYRPYEFSVMSEFFTFHMNHSSSYMDLNDTGQAPIDESPFSVQGVPKGKGSEASYTKRFSLKSSCDGRRKSFPFPNAPPPPASNASSGASSTETDPTDEEFLSMSGLETETEAEKLSTSVSFASIFAPTEDTYGIILTQVQDQDRESYRRYSGMKNLISPSNYTKEIRRKVCEELFDFEKFASAYEDDSYRIRPPTVSSFSVKSYTEYVTLRETGAQPPKHEDLLKYQMYVTVA